MTYLKLYVSWLETTRELGDAEFGRLTRAMLRYAADAAPQTSVGNEKFLWPEAEKMIDAQRASYENKVSGAAQARNKKTAT